MGTTFATLTTPFDTNVEFICESSDEDKPQGTIAFFCYTHTPFQLFIFLVLSLTLVLIAFSGNAHVPPISCIVPVIPARNSARPNGNIPVFLPIFPHRDACFDFVQELFFSPWHKLLPPPACDTNVVFSVEGGEDDTDPELEMVSETEVNTHGANRETSVNSVEFFKPGQPTTRFLPVGSHCVIHQID